MSFGKNFLGQTIASVLAFAISLLLTPMMTRVFDPNAYGAFAIINGAAVFLATFMQFSMPSMIPISQNILEFRRLINVSLHLGTLATIASSAIAAAWIVYVVSNDHQWSLASISSIAMLPFLVVSISLQRISQNIVIATREFNRLAMARVMHPVVAKPIAIAVGLLLAPSAAVISRNRSAREHCPAYLDVQRQNS
ncbi:MAG: hypothetical protein IPO95_13180 [Rhodanobacteraceae bacterium]|nr:hypothetical protein [Rhodanobacteraceae bacterium]